MGYNRAIISLWRDNLLSKLEILAIVLIVISAVFKGLALRNLSNQSLEFEIRKKKYLQMNIPSYIFLIPGVILLVYLYFIAK